MDSTLNEKKQSGTADEPLSRLEEQLFKLAHDAPRQPSDIRTPGVNTLRPAVSGNRISLGGWVLRGFAGMLLAGSIGVAGVTWLRSPGDAAKTAPSQPAPLVQAAAATSPELTPLLQSMARDLASMGKEIEQLKAGRELLVRDNASVGEQVRVIRQQLASILSRASEQNGPPIIAAIPQRPTPPSPWPAAPAARKPVPTPFSAQTTGQPSSSGEGRLVGIG